MSSFRLFRFRRRALVIAATLAAVVVLAACGGSSGGPGASGTPTGPASTGPGPSGIPSPGGSSPTGGTTAQPSDKPSASVKPSPGQTAAGSGGTLALRCARRGVDQQTIVVTTKPGGPAGFNTIYSDGSSSVDGTSSYSSGFDAGFASSDGSWRSTWLVPANAPTGVATVRVVTQDGSFDLPYMVVAQNGSCPS